MKFFKKDNHIVLDGILLAPKEILVNSEWRACDSGSVVKVIQVYTDERSKNTFVRFTAGVSKVELTAFRFQTEYNLIINDNCLSEGD